MFLGSDLTLIWWRRRQSLFTVRFSALVFLRHCLRIPFSPTLISFWVSSFFSVRLKCLSPFDLLSAVFTHLISQLLRDQNQLHFGSVLPASAPLTAFRMREVDSIRVAESLEDQFNSCQEYFNWLISVFNTMGKFGPVASSAVHWRLWYWKWKYCSKLICISVWFEQEETKATFPEAVVQLQPHRWGSCWNHKETWIALVR